MSFSGRSVLPTRPSTRPPVLLRALALTVALTLALTVAPPGAVAAPESDPGYGSDGATTVSARGFSAVAPILDPTGGVLVREPGPAGADTLQRVTPQGVLDPDFGEAGVLRLSRWPEGFVAQGEPLPTADGGFWRVALRVGERRTLIRAERFTVAGRRDRSGSAAIAVGLPVSATARVQAVRDRLGRLVLALPVGGRLRGVERPLLLLRVTADGALDPSFGAGGIVAVPRPDRAPQVVPGLGGALLIASVRTSDRRLRVTALRADGRPQRRFGRDGVAVLTGVGLAHPDGAVVDDWSRLLVPVTRGEGGCGFATAAVLRLDADGTRDAGFAARQQPVRCDVASDAGPLRIVRPRVSMAGPGAVLTLDTTTVSSDARRVRTASDRLIGLLDDGARWEGLGPDGIAVLPADRTVVGLPFALDGTSDLAVITATYPDGDLLGDPVTLQRLTDSVTPAPPAPPA